MPRIKLNLSKLSILEKLDWAKRISGARYWFRVAAVGAGGQSGWSDISTRIAP